MTDGYEPRLALDMALDAEPVVRMVYLAYWDDLLLDIYEDERGATERLAAHRDAFPSPGWIQRHHGHWISLGNGGVLCIQAREVLPAQSPLHVDGATGATHEAL